LLDSTEMAGSRDRLFVPTFDNAACFPPLRPVPGVFRRIIALMLLALWLPATSHCAIDAMTDWFGDACSVSCEHAQNTAHADACDLVEGGGFAPAAVATPVPVPHLTPFVCLACLHARLLADAEPVPPHSWAKDDPAAWVPAWRFALRAAPPARAPNLS
jgi:hypothetical protein